MQNTDMTENFTSWLWCNIDTRRTNEGTLLLFDARRNLAVVDSAAAWKQKVEEVKVCDATQRFLSAGTRHQFLKQTVEAITQI